MKNLPRKALALLGVAGLALLGLVVLAIAQGRWDTLLVGVIAFVCTLFAAGSYLARGRQSGPAELKQIAAGVARLEHTVTSSPRMLDGSSERQIAETAARFDWLARRHATEADRLDTFMKDLEASVARQHEEVITQIESLRVRVDTAPGSDSDREATGRGL